jgi:hypothetical protein
MQKPERSEARAVEVARAALCHTEVVRTNIARPVNGSEAYSYVMFQGQRICFYDREFANDSERDAGTAQAAAYAGKINETLLDLATRAAMLAFASEPLSAASVAGTPSREEVARVVDLGAFAQEWFCTEDQEHETRLRVCAERRRQWGDDDCDKDGSCEECTGDLADEHETEASKARRVRAFAKADAILALFASPSDGDGNGGKPQAAGEGSSA